MRHLRLNLGVGRMLKEEFGIELDMDKCNHNGSGIALGHPVGCTASESLFLCI